jgi:hypothetical protein
MLFIPLFLFLQMHTNIYIHICNAYKKQEDFKESILALTGPFLTNLKEIVGCDTTGKLTAGGIAVEKLHRQGRMFKPKHEGEEYTAHERLVAIGWRWGQHISEAWRVMFITGAYYLVSVTLGVAFFRLVLMIALKFAVDDPSSGCWDGVKFPFDTIPDCDIMELAVGTGVNLLDGLLYIMFPVLVHRIIRYVEGTPLYHRFGKRSIIIADNPWIGRCMESYVVKLYALAYGFVTPEVHSSDPVDPMIHDQACRSVRGLLVAVR